MKYLHASLTESRWNSLSLAEQMANIGAEVGRALNWQERSHSEYASKAAKRALELLYFTINDSKNRSGLKELTRTREILVDLLLGTNEYQTDKDALLKYFLAFNMAARLKK